jgi:hypothetical protein
MAELRIPIIVENKGKKAFKETDRAITGLTKNFKKLAGAAGIGLSTAAVINFGKKAAMAFIEDEKAARQLSIAVKNLGIAFETPRIESFISDLSAATGVVDDQLRPAMQKLLTTTGSVTKSQELLAQAVDISAGSGIAFETVAQDLANAYVGQTKGLSKYNLGLTKAELKTMKFSDVQAKLSEQFKGANAGYLETYAGKFQLINTAVGEASEKIGGALVESLVAAFAAGDPQEFVAKIEGLAAKIASMVATAVFGFKKLYYLTSDQAILASLNPFDNYENDVVKIIDMQEKMFRASFESIKMGYIGSMPIGIYATPAERAAAKKLEEDAAKRAKQLAASQAKQLAESKKKLALDRASKTLNLEAIGIEAALKGKISETDRISLLLQKAILEGNATLATQLSDQLEAAIKRQNELRQLLLTTPKAPNPYEDWKIPADLLSYTAATLGVSAETVIKAPETIGAGMTDATQELIDALIAAAEAQRRADAAQAAAEAVTPNVNVKVEVAGEDVTAIITQQQVNDSLSGTFNSVGRAGSRGSVGLL